MKVEEGDGRRTLFLDLRPSRFWADVYAERLDCVPVESQSIAYGSPIVNTRGFLDFKKRRECSETAYVFNDYFWGRLTIYDFSVRLDRKDGQQAIAVMEESGILVDRL